MSLLKEMFRPKNKKDGITMAIILMAVGGFLVYEGMSFIQIMQNPSGLDTWYETATMPTDWYVNMGSSYIYNTSADLNGYTIYAFTLSHLDNLNVSIEFDAQNCIIEMFMITSGYSNADGFFPKTSEILNTTMELYLRDMNNPKDFDVLFIKVLDMGNSGIKLLHKVSLIDT